MSGAEERVVWGTGEPRREFLHVDDLAEAVLFLLENYDSSEIMNVGCGEDISIRQLVELICEVVGFEASSTLTVKTGRHATQIARCFQNQKARLAADNFAAARHRPALRMVP